MGVQPQPMALGSSEACLVSPGMATTMCPLLVCVCMYVNLCAHECICMCTWRPTLAFLSQVLFARRLLVRQGLSWDLGLSELAKLAHQIAQGVCLSFAVPCLEHITTPSYFFFIFVYILGSDLDTDEPI